jgi:cell division protein FtsX
MKKIVLTLALAGIFISANSQQNKGLAQVRKMSSIEVYVYSEPLRDYEIVGKTNMYSDEQLIADLNVINKAVKGTDRASDARCQSMDEQIRTAIKKALKLKMRKKNPIDFDAIMIDSDDVLLLKFTSEPEIQEE